MEISKPVIGVFCGSSHGSDAAYAEAARRFGALIAERGFDLVFGGGYVGLMGECARAARSSGARITGVLPEFLRHLEPPAADEEAVILTPDLQERKRIMLAKADGFAVLPGGLGTLDEFFEVITSVQLHVFAKPIVVLNTKGFYGPLRGLLDHLAANAFANRNVSALYDFAATPEDAVNLLQRKLKDGSKA